MSKDLFPRAEISTSTDQIENELNESHYELNDLILMLEQRSVHRYYNDAVKGLCESALLGLALMVSNRLFHGIFTSIYNKGCFSCL